MCGLGLGWPWLWGCLVWVPRGAPSLPKGGTPREDPPKDRKAGIKWKPKGNMDPQGNVNLPGTGWPWRSFPTAIILWVNLLCPPCYQLRVSCQDFFLVGPAAPGQRLPSPTPPLHPEHHPEYLDELEQKTAAPVPGSDFCASSERQVPLTEKWHWVWFGIQEAISSKMSVLPAARSPISKELADE